MLEFKPRFQAFSGFVTFCDMEFKWALTFDLFIFGAKFNHFWLDWAGENFGTWIVVVSHDQLDWLETGIDCFSLVPQMFQIDLFIFLHIEFFKYWKLNVKISNSNLDGTDFLPKEWKLDVAIWGNDAGGKTRGKSLFSCVRVWKRINVPDSLNVFYSFIQHLSNSHRFTAHSQQSASTNTKHQKSTGHPADAICVNSITDKRRAALLITTV